MLPKSDITASTSAELDYQAIFSTLSAPCIILSATPDFTILAVNEAYMQATFTERDTIIGQKVFEVFPDNPSDDTATGTSDVSEAFLRVLRYQRANTIPVQKFDIYNPQNKSFVTRYWSLVNTPVFNKKGEMIAIINLVEDMTALMLLQEKGLLQATQNQQLQQRSEEMASDISQREQEKRQIYAENKVLQKEIRQRQQAQEERQTISERLSFTLKAAKIGLWQLDLIANTIDGDETTLKLFGLTPQLELYPMDEFTDNIHPDDRPAVFAALNDCIEKDMLYQVEFRVVKDNEVIGYVASRAEVKRDNKGVAIALLGASWDISLIKEKELQRVQEAENYRHRLEEFIDTVCHELRNPLNGMYGCLETLKDVHGHFDTLLEKHQKNLSWEIGHTISQQRDNLQEIKATLSTCIEQQKVIVDDVLDLSKLENNKLTLQAEVFNPNQVIEQAVQMFQHHLSQKRLKIYYDLPANFYIKGDANRFIQIITNLLSNAIKFTQQGSITLTLDYQVVNDDKRQVNVQVKDTGMGMTADEVDQLFHPFTQANARIATEYGGTGLGLVICQKLVGMMDGSITVNSEKGRGTCFQFSIVAPPASEPQQEAKRRVSPASPTARPVKHVLAAEDNSINQKILANYLKTAGYRYHIAPNGLEALQAYKEAVLDAETGFDIVFMDIEMPVMDGLEATRQIRQFEKERGLPAVTIVGLSGNAREKLIQDALQIGMNAYITKPFKKEQLYAHINPSTSAKTSSVLTSPTLFSQYRKTLNTERYLKSFQKVAEKLLEQHYPFTVHSHQSHLTIELLPQLPERPQLICELLLKELKTMLQTVFSSLTFNQITQSASCLELQMATPEQASLVQAVLAQAHFAEIVQAKTGITLTENALSV